MSLVTRQTSSGLVLAEEAQDEARLGAALKQIDDRYVLQRHESETAGVHVYVVVCIVSEDQEAIQILTWADERGNPLPLSSGLIEEVRKWRPEARGRRGLDADQRNEQLREQTEQLRRDQFAAVSDDHRAFVERNRVGVALDTKPRKRYWQRNRPPQSGGERR